MRMEFLFFVAYFKGALIVCVTTSNAQTQPALHKASDTYFYLISASTKTVTLGSSPYRRQGNWRRTKGKKRGKKRRVLNTAPPAATHFNKCFVLIKHLL